MLFVTVFRIWQKIPNKNSVSRNPLILVFLSPPNRRPSAVNRRCFVHPGTGRIERDPFVSDFRLSGAVRSRVMIILSLLSLLIQQGHSAPAPQLPSLNLLEGKDGYLLKEYINAITAYGPGLGVYTPYQYVDIAYNNIPFVGKIPVFGKEGTSSKLGISPFYPPQGNPSNPFPPLYRARPLPLHVPEPQDVVAVPLDEEALHGEPLFPPELVLPGETPAVNLEEGKVEQPMNPFGSDTKGGFLVWPEQKSDLGAQAPESVILDRVTEENKAVEEVKKISPGRDGERSQKTPVRTKRIF